MTLPVFIRAVILVAVAGTAGAAAGSYTVHNLGYGAAYDINFSRTVVGFSTSSGQQRAFSYSGGVMTSLGTLGPDPFSLAYDINELGDIVGTSYGSSHPHGFLYRGGVMNDIGTLGFATYANAINNAGTIVGESQTNAPFFPSHAFQRSGDAMTDLGTLGGLHSAAAGINSAGTIAGWADLSGTVTHAFTYNGTMNDIGTLGGPQSFASDINDDGTVVGWSLTPVGDFHAFRYSSGVMTDLTPGSSSGYANAINSTGDVVGQNNGRAFLYRGGVMTDLTPYLSAIGIVGFSEALGINNRGDIVGEGRDASDREIAFLLIVPEPSSAALLAFVSLGLILSRHYQCRLSLRRGRRG